MSDRWTPFCAIADFPSDGKMSKKLGDWRILLVKEGDQFFGYNDCCTHQAAKLSDGRIRRGSIMCPLHGARFEVVTGRCLGGSYPGLLPLAVRERNGCLEVALPDRSPEPHENPV